MGSGTGPADPATDGSTFALWCLKGYKCDLRSPNFNKFSTLHTDNRPLGRQVSLIAGLKHMKQTMEFCVAKANRTTLHYVIASFVLFYSVRPLFIAGMAAS